MSLSRARAWLKNTTQPTRTWLKNKSKSKPFQWVISIGQGMSLGSSLHDALTKLLSVSTLAGLTARILGNVNYGMAALVGIILAYMTRNAIGTNIKNMDEQGEKVLEHTGKLEEHEIKLEAGDKQFFNQQIADIKLLEILIEMNAERPVIAFKLNQLLEEKINCYNPFGKPTDVDTEERKQQNALNGLYRAGSNSSVNSRSPDYDYHEMIEITHPSTSPSRSKSQAYSNSARFFPAPATNLQIPIFTHAATNTIHSNDHPTIDVAIGIHGNDDEHKESPVHISPRAVMGSGSSV